MTEKTLVIGIGNSLRKDDAVGRQVIDALHDCPRDLDLALIIVDSLLPELAEDIAAAPLVVFVDAQMAPEAEPGTVLAYPLADGRPTTPGALLHALSPEGVLHTAAALYGRRPPAYMVTVVGEDFGHGQSLTDAVCGAVTVAVDRIRAITQQTPALA